MGIAVMGAILASEQSAAKDRGESDVGAFMSGLHRAFYTAASISFAGAAVALLLVRNHTKGAAPAGPGRMASTVKVQMAVAHVTPPAAGSAQPSALQLQPQASAQHDRRQCRTSAKRSRQRRWADRPVVRSVAVRAQAGCFIVNKRTV